MLLRNNGLNVIVSCSLWNAQKVAIKGGIYDGKNLMKIIVVFLRKSLVFL